MLYPLSYGSSGSPAYKGPPPMAGVVPGASSRSLTMTRDPFVRPGAGGPDTS